MNEAYLVDRALKAAGVPVIGVSIGDPADRATWTVHLRETATKEEAALAAQVMHAVDISDSAAADVSAADRLSDPFTRALMTFLATHLQLSEEQVGDELTSGLRGPVKEIGPDPMPPVRILPEG